MSAQIDERAVRVRVGGGRQEWRPAECLTIGFPHFLNKSGEPGPQAHVLTLAPALDQEGMWRTRDNAAFLRQLQGAGLPIEEATKVCGRRRLGDRMIESCRSMGIDVRFTPVFSSQELRVPHGATVQTPGMTIEAGSVRRDRRAEIIAAQQLKATLGVAAPTAREIRLLLENAGHPVASLP